jgi:hypothetical protein
LRGADIEGRGHGKSSGENLGGLDVLLDHSEMAFASGERLGKVLGDERWG